MGLYWGDAERLRDGLGQWRALAAVKTRDGVVLNDNGIFCHNIIVQISICKDTNYFWIGKNRFFRFAINVVDKY